MIQRSVAVLSIVSLAIVLSVAGCVSAAERAIQPGASYSVDVDISFAEPLSYSWSSDVALAFEVRDPADVVIISLPGSLSSTELFMATSPGTYTLTWTNNAQAVAHLTFSVSGGFDEVTRSISLFVWGMVIAAIVIVCIVVIIVIVLVMGGRKPKAQQPMGPPPQMASQALAAGRCPACGTVVAPDTSFCSRCGTRFR